MVGMKPAQKTRCSWVGSDPQMQAYHDTVWGRPKKEDRDIFEALVLDTNQAGLSWKCILHKRDNFAKAFYNFDPKKVSKMTDNDVERLMQDAGIIRHRGKIAGTINNAKLFLEIQKEYGTCANYIWDFTDPGAMSKDLKRRGFAFTGPTMCYAFMQGIGMVDDHEKGCFLAKK